MSDSSSTAIEKPFAVEHTPMVWVYRVYYDRNGKEVARGRSGQWSDFGLTKREILQQIRWGAAADKVTINYTPVKPASH